MDHTPEATTEPCRVRRFNYLVVGNQGGSDFE